jgi:hypothetical protein
MMRDRTVLTLVSSLVLLLLTSFIQPASAVVPSQNNALKERFWVLKTHNPGRFNMILAGDSRVLVGMSPQAMENTLKGYRILNFGYNEAGLSPILFTAIENRLDPTKRPNVIVLGVSPYSLSQKTAMNSQFVQEDARPFDYVFSHLYLYPGVIFSKQFKLDYFFAAKQGIVPNAGNVIQINAQWGLFNEYHDDGWMAAWRTSPDPTFSLAVYRELFSTAHVSPEIVQGVMRQTQIWHEQGIQVFGVRIPTTLAMKRLEDDISGFDEQDFKSQFGEAHGIWLDIPIEPYESYDGSHLTKASAVQFSSDLARLIQQFSGP